MSSPSNASLPPISSLPLGVDLSSNFDGLFYGYVVSTALFGITIVQAWIYLNTNRDKWPLRCLVICDLLLVGTLVALDFVTTCLDSQILHRYFVANFGNLLVLQTISTSLTVELLITIFVVCCVEVFFAYRVHLLRRFHWIVPAIIVLSAIGAAAAGITTTVAEFQDNSSNILQGRKQKLEMGFGLALTAFSDTVATGALSWAFAKSKTGIKRTDTLLQKLFEYSVVRGLFVTVDQTMTLILLLTKPEKLWWMPFHLSLSKVYVITMVAMLNSRDSLRNISGGIITDSDMFGWSTSINGAQNHDSHVNASKTRSRATRADTVYTSPSSDAMETRYRAGQEEVVRFPRAQAKVGQDSDIEMEDFAQKGVRMRY